MPTVEGAAASFASQGRTRARRWHAAGPNVTATELVQAAGLCHYCEGPAPSGWDHVVPFCQGGSNSIDNIAPCCPACNRQKGLRTPEQWRAGLPGFVMQGPPGAMLRIKEVRDMLTAAGIPYGHVQAYNHAASGELNIGAHSIPVQRFGRHYRVARARVQALIEEVTGEG